MSDTYEDTKLSYDMIFKMRFTISVRIRNNKYIHWNDLTIRSKSQHNVKTELDKIMEGKAQIYFYAYMTKDYTDLEKIYICNVEVLRNLYKSNNFNKQRYNKDGSGFIGFDLKQIEKESIKNNYLYYKVSKKEKSSLMFWPPLI